MKCFKVFSEEIKERLDPNYVFNWVDYSRAKPRYAPSRLEDFLLRPPQYGANETAVDGDPEKDYRYIRITDIDEYGNLRNDGWKTAKSVETRYLLQKDDLLFARSGATAGKAYLHRTNNGRYLFAGYLIRFNIEPKKANPRYVFYYTQLNRYHKWVKLIQRPSGQPNINSEEYKSLEIPLPPLTIQNEIVQIMDAAYEAKRQKEAEAERLLNSIDDYVLGELGIQIAKTQRRLCFTVLSKEVLGRRTDPLFYSQKVLDFVRSAKCGYKTIADVSEYLKAGFAAGNQFQAQDKTNAVIQIRPTNLGDFGRLKFDKNIYLKTTFLQVKQDDLLQAGEVLFNNTNSQDLVGKTAYFNLQGHYFCSNHITRIKSNERIIHPSYLCLILNLYEHAKVFFSICTNWNNQSGVNVDLLGTLPIPLPDLELQDRIANAVNGRMAKAESLRQEAQVELEAAKALVEKMILGKED